MVRLMLVFKGLWSIQSKGLGLGVTTLCKHPRMVWLTERVKS